MTPDFVRTAPIQALLDRASGTDLERGDARLKAIVRDLLEATGAPFLLHQDDLFIADSMPASARVWLGHDVPPAPWPDAFPTDGQDLEIAGVTMRVIHTPGHTPDGVSGHS